MDDLIVSIAKFGVCQASAVFAEGGQTSPHQPGGVPDQMTIESATDLTTEVALNFPLSQTNVLVLQWQSRHLNLRHSRHAPCAIHFVT